MSDASASARSWQEVWTKRLLVIVCGALLMIGLTFVGAAFLPRWWAHRVGDQVNGSISAGVAIGLFYGFVFTLLPLAVLRVAFGKRRSWRTFGWFVALAVALAIPNLLTLGIVLGTGNAAHAGERTFDVEAPAFRYSALVGAILAVLALAILQLLLSARRRSRSEVARLRKELKAHEQESSPEPSP